MENSKFPFNIIIIIFILFALVGLYWLDRLGLDSGSAYLWLFVIGTIFIIITFIAKNVAKWDFWYEIPINKTTERGFLMLFLGILTLGILVAISSISGLNFYSTFAIAPLAQFSASFGSQAFSSLYAATSPFWTFFIVVFSASVIEEIVLGWAFVMMGSLVLGYGLRKLLKLDFNGNGNKTWDFMGALVFSIIMFTVLHTFNGTYKLADGSWNNSAFMFAAVFRLILNMFIYKFGNFGLLFSIGVHAMNNAVTVGKEVVFDAFSTFPGGIILFAIIILLLFFGITSIKKVWEEGEMVAKDFLEFD